MAASCCCWCWPDAAAAAADSDCSCCQYVSAQCLGAWRTAVSWRSPNGHMLRQPALKAGCMLDQHRRAALQSCIPTLKTCQLPPPVPGDLAGEGLDAGATACYFLQRLLQLRCRCCYRQLLCIRQHTPSVEIEAMRSMIACCPPGSAQSSGVQGLSRQVLRDAHGTAGRLQRRRMQIR